jgi:hypothetical protein
VADVAAIITSQNPACGNEKRMLATDTGDSPAPVAEQEGKKLSVEVDRNALRLTGL